MIDGDGCINIISKIAVEKMALKVASLFSYLRDVLNLIPGSNLLWLILQKISV